MTWLIRTLGFSPLQIEHNAHFAVALFVVAGINVFAVIAFVARKKEGGALVLAAVRFANVIVSLWASVYEDNFAWFVLDG